MVSFMIRDTFLSRRDLRSVFPFPGTSDEIRSFGSVDFWFRLRVPMTETIRLYKEKVKAVGYVHSALSPDKQVSALGFHPSELPAEPAPVALT